MNYPHSRKNCSCGVDPNIATCTILSANGSFCKLAKYASVLLPTLLKINLYILYKIRLDSYIFFSLQTRRNLWA